MPNPGERKFQGSKTSSQSRYMYNKGKNNHQFFIYGPQYKNKCIFGYSGGGGWGAHKYSNRAYFASQLSSHLYQSTYKIWNQSDKDFFSYRENDEMSADTDADAA